MAAVITYGLDGQGAERNVRTVDLGGGPKPKGTLDDVSLLIL